MHTPFALFFQGKALEYLLRAVQIALEEDGPDLTSRAVFSPADTMRAEIVAKEDILPAGLPIAELVLKEAAKLEPGAWELTTHAKDGVFLRKGAKALTLEGGTRLLLRSERVILNFLCHLSGIAGLTARYVKALSGTGVTLLDTRKTLPGLRCPEKYAVLVGGGSNHRRDLAEILMLKDNHLDAAGGVAHAVERLRAAYTPSPPIEVECRCLEEVLEAVLCKVDRIMLDNMDAAGMQKALEHIPADIEVEISGGISLDNVGTLAVLRGPRRPDFVSVGRIIHSAPYADFSMKILGH